MNFFQFPYKENSLEGVFGLGVRTFKFPIRYGVSLSSAPSIDHKVENCFDGNPLTICHTDAYLNGTEYLQIQFYDFKFKIEGFAIQNRPDGYWNPLNYVIQGSNDGINFVNISFFNEISTEVCNSGGIRTRRISTNFLFSFFRLRTTGAACTWNDGMISNKYLFNMAEFDLFGYFGNDCFCTQIQKQTVFYISIAWFIMLIYS